ncbi:MAG TPA: hypothetical protein V6C78_07935 [Crinalium sp.]|jgi:hypothetical protein
MNSDLAKGRFPQGEASLPFEPHDARLKWRYRVHVELREFDQWALRVVARRATTLKARFCVRDAHAKSGDRIHVKLGDRIHAIVKPVCCTRDWLTLGFTFDMRDRLVVAMPPTQ